MTMKVLAIADAGIRTGFERVAREILGTLHTDGRADVTLLGINYHGQREIDYPFPVHPISYNASDQMGYENLNKAIDDHTPDVVWILNDLWHTQIYGAIKARDVPMACYFPIDAPNLKWHYAMGLGAVSAAASYTKFGANEVAASIRSGVDMLMGSFVQLYGEGVLAEKRPWMNLPAAGGATLRLRMDRLQRFQNIESYHIVPHGLRTSEFSVRDKGACRDLFGIPRDRFVVLNVNANQPRKRFDITMRAFAMLASWAPDAHLVIHCAGHTMHGWDLRQLAAYLNIEDRITFVHEFKDQLTEDELIALYNTADVQVNTGGGEGWGLPSFEGAACGVPQLVPDWSATRELWKGYGALLPVTDWRIESKFINTAHANVDARSTGAILVDLWLSPERREMLAKAGFQLVNMQPTWEQVADMTYKVLEEAVGEKAATPVSFEDILAARVGDVRSELYEALWWERGEPVTRAVLSRQQEGGDAKAEDVATLTESGESPFGASSSTP